MYAARETRLADAVDADVTRRLDALVDVIVNKYSPLPALDPRTAGAATSAPGAPQWFAECAAALARAKSRLLHAPCAGMEWYWPDCEGPASRRWRPDENVRLLTPFDPIVRDRRRFLEIFWDWAYRSRGLHAGTQAQARLRTSSCRLLWHERVIGWGNAVLKEGHLHCSFGYASGKAPRSAAFRRALGRGSRTYAHVPRGRRRRRTPGTSRHEAGAGLLVEGSADVGGDLVRAQPQRVVEDLRGDHELIEGLRALYECKQRVANGVRRAHGRAGQHVGQHGARPRGGSRLS